ncbi:hypothetical protein KSW92_16945 [Prevotella copri]|uniref:hypothetical protein n=1 Tax=Segatella copri TaxID=165179 RepID=UPI001C3942C2|nr:hypothetical protein [Segatella copri]MBV3431173.1 hypothetical protein [Segatella copri]
MEDLPIGSEIVLKVVESEKEECNDCFFYEKVATFMKLSAIILIVAQALEKIEKTFNSRE